MVSTVQKIELSEEEWIENESINRLMKSRRGTIAFASLASLLMAIQLQGHIHNGLVLIWLTASLFFIFYRYILKNKIANDLRSATVAMKVTFVKKYSFIWSLNALIWGLASWLFLASMPVQNQYICATILNGVGFVAVLNLNSHRKIARQYINTLMGTYVVACLWHIGVVENFNSAFIQYAHLISLLFIWLFLHMLDNRNYAAYRHNLALLYRNNLLIHSLNLKSQQLAAEKQMVLNTNEVTKRFYLNAAYDVYQPIYALKTHVEHAIHDASKVDELLLKMHTSCRAAEGLLASSFNIPIKTTPTLIATESSSSNTKSVDIDIDI
jgi:hypothetical protein